MFMHNPEVLKLPAEEKIRSCLRQAETRRLLREASQMKPSWLSELASRLLSGLDRALVRASPEPRAMGVTESEG